MSVRLGDYAKARTLLLDIGDIGGARQLLGNALTVELQRRGDAHPVVAQIRSELAALGLGHATKPYDSGVSDSGVILPDGIRSELAALGLDHSTKPYASGVSDSGVVLPKVVTKFSKLPRNEMELRVAMAASDSASKSLQRRRLDPEKVRELFENWAGDPSGAVSSARGDAAAKLGRGAERAKLALSREALGAALHRLTPGLSEADVDHVFAAADGDKDGRLDFSEFAEWFAECRSLHGQVGAAVKPQHLRGASENRALVMA